MSPWSGLYFKNFYISLFPPCLLGADAQHYLRCCVPHLRPLFCPLNKHNSQFLGFAFFFSVDTIHKTSSQRCQGVLCLLGVGLPEYLSQTLSLAGGGLSLMQRQQWLPKSNSCVSCASDSWTSKGILLAVTYISHSRNFLRRIHVDDTSHEEMWSAFASEGKATI